MVTLRDIAKEVGTTHGTVSLVLRGNAKKARISDKLSRKILEAAETLGYRKDDFASAMITGKANVSGLLIPDVFSEYARRLLDGMLRAGLAHDHVIKVIHYKEGMTVEEITDICLRQRLSGLVCFSMSDTALMTALHRQLIQHRILLVIPGADVAHISGGIQLLTDNYAGGREVFSHLYQLGHRRFVIGNSYCDMEWSVLRRKGFLDAAVEMGISPRDIAEISSSGAFYKEKSFQIDDETLRQYFTGNNNATAMFVLNDSSAMFMLFRLLNLGLRVPEDVALIGYGNSSFTQYSSPALSSVNEHLETIGQRCVDLIMEYKDSLEDFTQLKWTEISKVEVVPRKSTDFQREK